MTVKLLQILFLALVPVVSTAAQSLQADAKAKGMAVVRRVMAETALSFHPSLPVSAEGIEVVDFRNGCSATKGTGAAKNLISVPVDTLLRFGLSSDLPVSLIVNGTQVLRHERSRAIHFREIGYELYQCNDTVTIRLNKGTNEIVVQGELTRGRNVVLLHELVRPESSRTAVFGQPLAHDRSKSGWWYAGPFRRLTANIGAIGPVTTASRLPITGPAQESGWRIPSVQLTAELVIDSRNTFKRESYAEWTYANGTLLIGMHRWGAVTGDQAVSSFVRSVCDFTVSNLPRFRQQYEDQFALRSSNYRIFRRSMLDDTGGPAIPYAEVARTDRATSYMPLLREMASYVSKGQVRLSDGTLARYENAPLTVWADDMFMSVPFLLRMTTLTGDSSFANDAAQQVVQIHRYLIDTANGLRRHAWYESRKEQSPVCWGRANGWMVWATSEALLLLPRTHRRYAEIAALFTQHLTALRQFQDSSGLWHQVLDRPDSFEETSCTAMFLIGMIRGRQLGLLGPEFESSIASAWRGVSSRITDDGIVRDICRGTGISDSFEFYFKRERFANDPRGLGAVITAAAEMAERP